MKDTCLMRWNPAISSFTTDRYNFLREKYSDGWYMNWSIYDHKYANWSDRFVMLRVGDYKPGIVFYGNFESCPYEGEDWAGTDKMRYYVDMNCIGASPESDDPIISAEELEAAIPEGDWRNGHSGVVLKWEVARKLTALLRKKINCFAYGISPYAVKQQENVVARSKAIIDRFSKFDCHYAMDTDKDDFPDMAGDWGLHVEIPNHQGDNLIIGINLRNIYVVMGDRCDYRSNNKRGFESAIKLIERVINGNSCYIEVEYDEEKVNVGFITMKSPTCAKVHRHLINNLHDYLSPVLYESASLKDKKLLKVNLYYYEKSKDVSYEFRLKELTDDLQPYKSYGLIDDFKDY